MTAARLWAGLVATWAAAVASLAVVQPRGPVAAPSTAAAIVAGAVAGTVLFAALSVSLPLRGPRVQLAVLILLTAGAEEVVWRRFLLDGVGTRAGTLPALVFTTGLFAFAHRHGRKLHALTGACFGALYLLGGLPAAWAAHAAYDLALAGARARQRSPA